MTFFTEWWERYRQRRVSEHRAVGTASGTRRPAEGWLRSGRSRSAMVACFREPRGRCSNRDQQEALRQLLGECAQMQNAITKVMRDGYGRQVGDSLRKSRRIILEEEVGHVLAALEALYASGDLRFREVRVWKERRLGVRHASPAAAPTSQRENSASQ
jgi:hypothetical protein